MGADSEEDKKRATSGEVAPRKEHRNPSRPKRETLRLKKMIKKERNGVEDVSIPPQDNPISQNSLD